MSNKVSSSAEVPQQPGQPSIVPRTADQESEFLYEHVPEHGVVVCWDPPANANTRTGIVADTLDAYFGLLWHKPHPIADGDW